MLRDQILFTDNDRGTTEDEKGTSINNTTRNKEREFYKKQVDLAFIDQWFHDKILPMRTIDSSFTGDPSVKKSKPNGVCSQAFWFVYEEYENSFLFNETYDHYHMGQIVWRRFEDLNLGGFTTHTAAIMMKKDQTKLHKYELSEGKLVADMEGNPQYTEQELLQLHVYDLYYKKQVILSDWIKLVKSYESDHGTSNWIELGTIEEINN